MIPESDKVNFATKLFEQHQKQPFGCVLRRICYEIMQQIYRRTLMPKGDFSLIARDMVLKEIARLNPK